MGNEINVDKKSRERIVQELDKNFFVEASAGSGKTTSLVFRMVALIERGGENKEGVPVDKICTITFTKAAADEFFNRFQSLLSTRSILEPDESDKFIGEKTPDTVKRCQEALKNIDSCFLGTIDAFCNMIAHELPSELGIPSDSEVVDMDEYFNIVRDTYLRILKDEDHPLHDKALRFKEIFYKDVESLCVGAKAFLEMRHTDIIFDNDLLNVDLDKYLLNEKTWLLEVIKNLISVENVYKLDSKSGKERQQAQIGLRSNYYSLRKKSWNNCISSLRFAFNNIRDMNGFNVNAMGTDIEQYLDTSGKIKANSTLKYVESFLDDVSTVEDKLNEYIYQIYCDFIKEISILMETRFKNLGKFQFFDFLYYLNEAFKESEKGNRELINHILERHSYFLLDESQDTNPLQTEMFFHLTGTKHDPDWKKVKPKEGSLFIVGDPKQSIYSFRDANVSAYLENKKIFSDEDEVLYLTRNFRSNVQLRNWFNDVMDNLLHHGIESLEHPDIPITDEEKDNEVIPNDVIDGVYSYCIDTRDDGELIAKLILSLVGKEKIYSKNEDAKTPKKKERLVRYSDFMIVPRTTHVDKIIAALKKYHIPLTIEANIPFSSSQSLVVAKDLTLLLKAPQDIDKFLKVIHGDLYKLTEKDIINMKNDGFDLNISHPVDIKDQHLDKIIKELNTLYEETHGMNFSSTMLYILNNSKLNIFKKISPSNLEYTYFLIQKIKEKEEDSSLSTLKQLEDFINNFLESGDDQRSLRFKDKLDRVKLSNVHKVKGLQAPIVILAKPSQEIKEPTKFVDYSSLPPQTYFSEFSREGAFNSAPIAVTKRFSDMLPIWRESSQAEKERLEYVAATRAESVLIIGKAKTDSDETSPWKELYEKVDDKHKNAELDIKDIEPVELTPEDIKLGDVNINNDCHNLSHKYISPSQTRQNKINNNADEIDDAYFEKQEKKDATLIGTAVHRLMECYVSSRGKYSDKELIEQICRNEYPIDPEDAELIHHVMFKIKTGGFKQKNSTLDADIFKTLMSAKEVWCETPFSYLSKEGNIVSGVIDVIYLDQNDKYHIIDYKTNEENDVSILEAEYKDQLNHYVYALRKMGIDADVHIYHIDLKQ